MARRIVARSGTNQEVTSQHNRRAVLDALRRNGALSKADLARATSLTKQTVSNIIGELEGDGMVGPLEAVRGRGQPSTPYRLLSHGAFALGVQIDRHVARCVAVDLVGNVLVRREAELAVGDPARGVAIILDLVMRARQDLAATAVDTEKRLVGLCAAMPGPFGMPSQKDNPWMMGAWQDYPLLEELARGTGLEVALQNDAAAAATAERMIGALRGVDDAVCLYLGYGLGAGLLLHGELYRGMGGNAGEVGMIVGIGRSENPLSQLEHRASIAVLCERLGIDPGSHDLFERLDEKAKGKDPTLMAWVAQTAQDFRLLIQMLEQVLDPQTTVLCGGLPPLLARLLVDAIHPLLPSTSDRAKRLLPRLQLGLTDRWSVAIGAAAEPISRAFDPRYTAMLKTMQDRDHPFDAVTVRGSEPNNEWNADK